MALGRARGDDAEPKRHQQQGAELGEALRARGLRMTLQRRLVLDALAAAEDHVSAEDILDHIHSTAPQVNISTIYRTLETLEEAGIVYHTHLGHGMSQWHVARMEVHQHLVCEVCGRVQRVSLEHFLPFQRAIAESHGFRADPRHFAVIGRCRDCAADE